MRLISWNVAARVKKQPRQLEAVLSREPDLLALQEVTAKTSRMWREGLQAAGYDWIVTSFEVSPDPEAMVGGRGRGILIASRTPLEILNQEGLEMPWPERLVSVLVQHPALDFELHAAYIPPGASHKWLKIETFEGIYHYLARHNHHPRMLCGDFNSPKQELPDGRTIHWGERLTKEGGIEPEGDPRWPRGERLVIRDLEKFDLGDVYRRLHGYQKEDYSWVVQRKGKVVSRRRFDHVFASRDLNPISCQYLHDFRLKGLSDHSGFEVDFSLGNVSPVNSGNVEGIKPRKYRIQEQKAQKRIINQKKRTKENRMSKDRSDIRDPDPGETHRGAFLAGWTQAVQGELFSTVFEKKIHANMGNLFGWIYGEQSQNFKLATWYRYLEHAGNELQE